MVVVQSSFLLSAFCCSYLDQNSMVNLRLLFYISHVISSTCLYLFYSELLSSRCTIYDSFRTALPYYNIRTEGRRLVVYCTDVMMCLLAAFCCCYYEDKRAQNNCTNICFWKDGILLFFPSVSIL